MSDPRPDWLDYTDTQIRDDVLATGQREADEDAGPPVSFASSVWETMALEFQRHFATVVRPMARHADPREADGWYLRLHGIFAGVAWRDTARATQGYVHLTSATGGTLAAGTELRAGGAVFATDTRTRLASGVATAVAVTATTGGAAGNVASGTEVAFEGTPDPADVVAELRAAWVTVPGYDADTADTERFFRERVLAGYQVRGEANTLNRYRLAALGVQDVAGVRVSSVAAGRAPRGYGSADISVLFAGRLPTDDQLALVQAEIELEQLGGRDVRAAAPHVVTVAVTAKITGSAAEADVEDAIDAWWRQSIAIGDGLLVQTLYRSAHAAVAGVDSIDYDSPADNIPARPNTWLQPSITVTAA